MNEKHAVRIPIKKGKLWFWSVCSVLFIVLGFFFVLDPEDFRSPLIQHWLFIRILGFIILLVFGYFLGVYIPQLIDREPGLIIDESGVKDRSTEVSIGRIAWADISSIYPKYVARHQFMIVEVKDPEKYIARSKGEIQRSALEGNHKICGSPIAIPATNLRCNFEELERLLTEAYKDNRTTI